ncbi:MAG: hypothetical protein M1839_005235 [Geoglossum umbratile]|nr:MAG: hypothetical protein M1839_005235 [Geoglossum umbratile]
MSSSSQPNHAGVDSPYAVRPNSTTPTPSLDLDSGYRDDPPEYEEDVAEESPGNKKVTVDRMTENMIYALLEEKRRELDDEIAEFKAAKDEEFRTFERDMREGRSVGVTNKNGREVETLHAVKKRHRGNGYGIPPSPSHSSGSPKALDAHFPDQGVSLRNCHLPGDQTPQQTPPDEREHEFQGLFTPTYMPLLDYGGHRSLARSKSERSALPSESPLTSSHSKDGGSAQPSFTRPALPKLTLPHNTRSSSLPPTPQQSTTSPSRRNGSTTSLQSSIRHSSDDQKPRAPKQVKFKFDNTIVLPTASYDRSQELIASTSDNAERVIDQDFDDTQREAQQAKVISSQEMFSTSPLSEPSPSRSPKPSKLASEPGPSEPFRNTNHLLPSQAEGNGSLDGLGGKWSKIKEKDVVGGGGSAVQDESAEVISRAEYEEAEDEDDYADGGLFDLDETVADLPEPKKPKEKMRGGNQTTIANATNMPPLSPSSFHGYDLSLVIPTNIGSLADHYGSSLNRTRPATIPSSVPTDIGFGSKRPKDPTAGHRSLASRNGNPSIQRSHAGEFREESDIRWSSMRRRSSTKYDMVDPEDEPAKSKRLLYRNGATIPEEHGDEGGVTVSPMAASVPVQIPLSPVMGYTDNGDMDNNSYTPKTKSERSSVSSRKAKKQSDKENTAIPTTDDPTATSTFSISTSARTTSVDNPITDQFATATIGGPHRNVFGTDPDGPDGLGFYPPSVGQGNFMGNPFVSGSYASPGTIALAEAAAEVGSYVGSIDGCSGYDPADRSSYLKLKRGRNGGEAQSFGERMMLEDEKKAKKLSEKTKEKKNGRRVTQP